MFFNLNLHKSLNKINNFILTKATLECYPLLFDVQCTAIADKL